MKILLIGSGGREHALAIKLKESPLLTELYIAPGNPGTAELGQNVPISDSDFDRLVAFAEEKAIDLTFVGPETPLVNGIVDLFRSKQLPIVGPNKHAAKLEGSKAWSKAIMDRCGIPTAASQSFTDIESAMGYVRRRNTYPTVIKADGLAAGKGVVIAQNESEATQAIMSCFIDKAFGDAGNAVVIEEFLVGQEASTFVLIDGDDYVILGSAQDHKRAFDGDLGPNTGGMGAYSPPPIVTDKVLAQIESDIIQPLIAGLKEDGITFQGLLFIGLMIHDETPSVVEFNVRFGDPETQVILPLLQADLLELLVATYEHRLHSIPKPTLSNEAAVCVILASGGYPGSYQKDKLISGAGSISHMTHTHLVHAGTRSKDDMLYTSGGRVAGVVSKHQSLATAIEQAYKGVSAVNFEDMQFRKDIGQKAL